MLLWGGTYRRFRLCDTAVERKTLENLVRIKLWGRQDQVLRHPWNWKEVDHIVDSGCVPDVHEEGHAEDGVDEHDEK